MCGWCVSCFLSLLYHRIHKSQAFFQKKSKNFFLVRISRIFQSPIYQILIFTYQFFCIISQFLHIHISKNHEIDKNFTGTRKFSRIFTYQNAYTHRKTPSKQALTTVRQAFFLSLHTVQDAKRLYKEVTNGLRRWLNQIPIFMIRHSTSRLE